MQKPMKAKITKVIRLFIYSLTQKMFIVSAKS